MVEVLGRRYDSSEFELKVYEMINMCLVLHTSGANSGTGFELFYLFSTQRTQLICR